MKYDDDYTLYQLTVEDAQNVAVDVLNRKLTDQELSALEQYFTNIGLLDWSEKMYAAILSVVKK